VEIQVLVRDVGDDGHVIFHSRHALLREAVRGRLDHGILHTGSGHLRQIGLHLGRIGRGGVKTSGRFHAADGGSHRVDRANRVPRCRQDPCHQTRGRGLAVGPRHTDDLELAPRVAPQGGVQIRQSLPGIGHDHPGPPLQLWQVALHHKGHGTRLKGRRDKAVPIDADARDRHKQVARPDLARVLADLADGKR